METHGDARAVYRVNRSTYNQPEFYDEFSKLPKPKLTVSKVKESCLKLRLSSFGFSFLSSILTLTSFYTTRCIGLDVLSGITMAIFHIPQGMAYGVLAGLRPVNGLYTSFFPVLTYFFFGTSRHISVGTFSLASLLFSAPINRLSTLYMNDSSSTVMTDEIYNFRLGIAIMLTFCIGMLQILMGICQMGFLVTYLSGPLISGFMCASGFHIIASQLSAIFGIKLPKAYGPGNLVMQVYNFFAHITETNIATLIISIICITILYLFRNLINPWFKKQFKFPIPIEILIVALATVTTHFAELNKLYNVKIVGAIPEGLPAPMIPSFEYFSDVIVDVLIIAIVTFAITASLVKVYATDFGYDVLYNQELLALGISNIVGSFFQCHACCAALARSAVVITMGMASQIASLISCAILLLIFYLIGPYLYDLPTAVLSAIITVALTSTFEKVLDLKALWQVSLCDASVWLMTFLTTFFIDVPYGLVCGFTYAILTVVYRSQNGGEFVLGNADDTDLYNNLSRFERLKEHDGIKLIRFDGPLYFANANTFENTVYKLSGVNPVKLKRQLALEEVKQHGGVHERCHVALPKRVREMPCCWKCEPSSSSNCSDNASKGSPAVSQCLKRRNFQVSSVLRSEEQDLTFSLPVKPNFLIADDHARASSTSNAVSTSNKDSEALRYVVLDASSWMFIDTVGLHTIKQVIENYRQVGIVLFIACLQLRLRSYFAKSEVFSVLQEDMFFMTIHDAVLVAQAEMKQRSRKAGALPHDEGSPSVSRLAGSSSVDGNFYEEMTDLNFNDVTLPHL